MLVYWLLFAYFAVGVFLGSADPHPVRNGNSRVARRNVSVFLIVGALAIALLVGLRYRVGGDWAAYDSMFSFARYADDRLALYILPLQIVILSRVPGTLISPALGRGGVVLYSFLVQFVWLNYAAHANYWVPYEFHPW